MLAGLVMVAGVASTLGRATAREPVSDGRADSAVDRALASLFSNYYEQYLTLFPLEATAFGDTRYNDSLPIRISPDFLAKERAFYESTLQRLDEMASKVDDPRLEQAREKLEQAGTIEPGEADPETAKQAMDHVQEAKRLLALTRKEHLKVIRQLELDKTVDFFDKAVRQHARPTEASSFDNLVKTAQRAIDNNSGDFESHLDDLRSRNFMILWRQDWFVIERFKWLAEDTYLFPDAREHAQLVAAGAEALKANDIDKLRAVVAHLDSIRIGSAGEDDMLAGANIVRS